MTYFGESFPANKYQSPYNTKQPARPVVRDTRLMMRGRDVCPSFAATTAIELATETPWERASRMNRAGLGLTLPFNLPSAAIPFTLRRQMLLRQLRQPAASSVPTMATPTPVPTTSVPISKPVLKPSPMPLPSPPVEFPAFDTPSPMQATAPTYSTPTFVPPEVDEGPPNQQQQSDENDNVAEAGMGGAGMLPLLLGAALVYSMVTARKRR